MSKKHELNSIRIVSNFELHLIISICSIYLLGSCTFFDLKNPESTSAIMEIDNEIVELKTSNKGHKAANFRVKKENPDKSIYNSTDEDFLEEWKKYSYMPESALEQLEDGLIWTDQNVHLYVEGAFAMGEHFYIAFTDNKILYTYEAAQKACKKIGPEWRLPTIYEVDALLWIDHESLFKPKGQWSKEFYRKHIYDTFIKGGKSSFSFPIPLPGFGHLYPNGHVEFNGAGGFGGFWTTDENGESGLVILNGTDNQGTFADQDFINTFKKEEGQNHDFLASCRCIKDTGKSALSVKKSLNKYLDWFKYELPPTFFKRLQDGHIWTVRDVNLLITVGYDHFVINDDLEELPFQEKRFLYTFEKAEKACKKIGQGWQIPEAKDVKNLLLATEPSLSSVSQIKFKKRAYELLTHDGKTKFSFRNFGYAYKDKSSNQFSVLKDAWIGGFWVYDKYGKPSMMVFDYGEKDGYLNSTIEEEIFTNNGVDKSSFVFLSNCRCVNKSS